MEDDSVDVDDDDDDDDNNVDGQDDSDYDEEVNEDDEEISSAPEIQEEESQKPQTSPKVGDSKYEVLSRTGKGESVISTLESESKAEEEQGSAWEIKKDSNQRTRKSARKDLKAGKSSVQMEKPSDTAADNGVEKHVTKTIASSRSPKHSKKASQQPVTISQSSPGGSITGAATIEKQEDKMKQKDKGASPSSSQNAPTHPTVSKGGRSKTRIDESHTPKTKSRSGRGKNVRASKDGTPANRKDNDGDASIINSIGSVLRPPPGLAPPPGFGGTSAPTPTPALNTSFESVNGNRPSLQTIINSQLTDSKELTLQVGVPSLIGSSFGQTGTGAGELLFPGSIGHLGLGDHSTRQGAECSFAFPSETPTSGISGLETATLQSSGNGNISIAASHQESLAPVLVPEDGQSGFDVMDFLDSILNEGAPLDDLEEATTTGAPAGSTLAPTPVLANPWAAEAKSRASAYGISFDEDDDTSSNASPMFPVPEGNSAEGGQVGGLGAIPLLTPAAILNAEDVDIDQDNKAVSFFAGLVNE
jgi:hypothetical protein